jgi:hypothetical protein
MAFSFEKFVQKSTRGLFMFIVICMVVPLVLWGYMGKSGSEREEDKGKAGTLYGTIDVSKAEYNRHLATAPASYWWKLYGDRMTMYRMQMGQKMDPKPEDLAQQAWEDIILLKEAKASGIEASEQEVYSGIRDVFEFFARGREEYKDETMKWICSNLLHIDFSKLHEWMSSHVVIEKLLNLISNSEFADYDKVYGSLLSGQKMAKVWYASFDPKDYLKDLKTPTTDEIANYYSKNKDRFKIPGKVQVAYLLADAEELKKKEAEPSEDAVKKYYTDNKIAEFAKPHEHKPGEDHKDDEQTEFKSFDEVKAEIPDKIKMKAAEKKAAEVMNRVDVALGAAATANNNKYPDTVFDDLKKKFGEEIKHDITLFFDQKQVEDIEKVVGSNSNLASWAFDPATKIGDISQKVKTGKGTALFRLSQKKDATESGISERVRETIVKELQKEQIKKKTQQVANNVVQEISTHGMMAARRKYPLDWRLTRYFKPGSDAGIDDPALGQAISQQLYSAKAGTAQVIAGDRLRNPAKADWAFVIYVEDLEDAPPEDVSLQFSNCRRSLDMEARRAYRDLYVKDTVKGADLKLDESFKKAAGKSPDSPPPQ